ncbi:MAG TPA: hypothetical protein DGT23_02110, partial [Micromonosporaceae bacterium]|nr:hypothetical protein [Micromonosporaceae bacterium]
MDDNVVRCWNERHENATGASNGVEAMMEFSAEQGTTRRDVIIRALGATAVVSGIAAGIPLAPNAAHAFPARQLAAQEDWRFCGNCHVMFFSGRDGSYYRENQRCAAGGLHNPLGYNFVLPYDVAET